MKTVTFVFLLILFCRCAWAQTIINVEKLQAYTKEGFYFGCMASLELEKGNSDVLEIEEVSVIGYHSKKHWIKLFTGMEFLSGGDDDLIKRIAGQLRYNYLFSPICRLFLFYQLQHNQLVLLERRQLIGSGIRKTFKLSNSTSLDVGSGIMYEKERLDVKKIAVHDDPTSECFRLTNLIFIKGVLSPSLSLINVSYFQPRVNRLVDFRFFDEISLVLKVSQGLSINCSIVYRYDNRPPSSVKRYDVSLKNGLILKF